MAEIGISSKKHTSWKKPVLVITCDCFVQFVFSLLAHSTYSNSVFRKFTKKVKTSFYVMIIDLEHVKCNDLELEPTVEPQGKH